MKALLILFHLVLTRGTVFSICLRSALLVRPDLIVVPTLVLWYNKSRSATLLNGTEVSEAKAMAK